MHQAVPERDQRRLMPCPAPAYDPDALDALISATTSPVIALTRDHFAALSNELRLGNAARAALARQAPLPSAIMADGYRSGIVRR